MIVKINTRYFPLYRSIQKLTSCQGGGQVALQDQYLEYAGPPGINLKNSLSSLGISNTVDFRKGDDNHFVFRWLRKYE
jgi:hypothetical protein